MAITSISGPKKGQNFNFHHFIVKNDPNNPLTWWGFFMFQCFVFFFIFAFSCLSFSSFPLLFDFLKPTSGPSDEVIGRNIYHNRPESKKRNSAEGSSGFIRPYDRYGNAGKTSKTIPTIAFLWPVKAIFEKGPLRWR